MVVLDENGSLFERNMLSVHERNEAGGDGRTAKSVVVAMLLGISIWLSSSEIAWAQEKRICAVGTEVFVYGKEQSLVDAMTHGSDRQANQEYPNELDQVFAVLLARAYPTPEEHSLARHTVDALCREFELFAKTKVLDSERNTWVATATRTKSFESVLKDMGAVATVRARREQLVNSGLAAMLRTTGCKSASVLGAPEAQRITNMLGERGTPNEERGLLGVNVDRWPIIGVLRGMPAAEAGLRDGDVVLRVNTRDVGKTEVARDGLKALHGVAGTIIRLTVKRGSETLTFEARRAPYAAASIRASVIDPGVVYIQIPLFEGSGIAQRVNELIRKHVTDATSHIILDLRGNPGGRAEEANAVADIFLDEKYLQIFQFRNGRRIAFKSKPGALDVHVIVLTNHDTGSSAEMLVIALHANNRATVIGEPTAGALFGKDFEKLRDGRMVVFRSEPTVLSPTGKDYSETGFPPDIAVDGSKGSGGDKILERAIQLRRTGQ